MAITGIYIFVLIFAVAGATPHRRSDDCMEASATLKDFLTRHDEWFEFLELGDVTFEYMYEGITGATLAEYPDDFLCPLEGLSQVDGLLLKLAELYYLEPLFSLVYNYVVVYALTTHQFLKYDMELSNPWNNVTESRVYAKLLVDLEASGIFSLDQQGFMWLYHVAEPSATGLPEFYPMVDDMSDEPLHLQAAQITDDIRKVWNMNVQSMSQYMEDPGAFLRTQILQWTGISLGPGTGAHYTVKDIINQILGAVESDEPVEELLLVLFRDHAIIKNVCNTVYPDIVRALECMAPTESNGASSYYCGPASAELFGTVIQALRSIGLLDLDTEHGDW